jgi:ribosomal protein S18 acetylase RimI-like enzyme
MIKSRTGIDFEIVAMTENDISEVLRISQETGLAPWSEADYISELKRDDGFALVIKNVSSKAIAGFMVMRLITNNNTFSHSTSIDLLNIAINKINKRTRLGTALLTETIRTAREIAPSTIWLEARCSNTSAIAFYEKHGFEKIVRRKNLFSQPSEDGWLMKLDIFAEIVT